MHMLWFLLFLGSISAAYSGETTVSVFPSFLAQGGRKDYDSNRWNKHMGLEKENLIPLCRVIGTDCGRWINPDLNNSLFKEWPQDPARAGHPDPDYLKDKGRQQEFARYLNNINSGYKNELVLALHGLSWPSWMNQSQHGGMFPNDLDPAAEMVTLLVQGISDYTDGQIPPYLEVMNEPDSKYQVMNFTTVSAYHKKIADYLHAKFDIRVSGPTLTSYSGKVDDHGFSFWKQVAEFIDVTAGHLDTFSFHSYNTLHVSDRNHRFSGMNEARLVAFVDLVESYYSQKFGYIQPLTITEYGRGPVVGISKDAPSGIVDFSTIYQANAHRFTHLALREYLEQSVVFILANEEWAGDHSLNWSLFTLDGNATRLVDVFFFWYFVNSNMKFLRTGSEYDGKERVVSPLALVDPDTRPNVITVLLHSYSQENMTVNIDFVNDWTTASNVSAYCIILRDGWYPNTTEEIIDLKATNGSVLLLPESTCLYRFTSDYNVTTLPTLNETTFYALDNVIPVGKGPVETTITVPNGVYYTAKLRVSASVPVTASGHLSKVMLNNELLVSNYTLFDSDKHDSDTLWTVWDFLVPTSAIHSGRNSVSVYFTDVGAGAFVSSVALVTGVIGPTENLN